MELVFRDYEEYKNSLRGIPLDRLQQLIYYDNRGEPTMLGVGSHISPELYVGNYIKFQRGSSTLYLDREVASPLSITPYGSYFYYNGSYTMLGELNKLPILEYVSPELLNSDFRFISHGRVVMLTVQEDISELRPEQYILDSPFKFMAGGDVVMIEVGEDSYELQPEGYVQTSIFWFYNGDVTYIQTDESDIKLSPVDYEYIVAASESEAVIEEDSDYNFGGEDESEGDSDYDFREEDESDYETGDDESGYEFGGEEASEDELGDESGYEFGGEEEPEGDSDYSFGSEEESEGDSDYDFGNEEDSEGDSDYSFGSEEEPEDDIGFDFGKEEDTEDEMGHDLGGEEEQGPVIEEPVSIPEPPQEPPKVEQTASVAKDDFDALMSWDSGFDAPEKIDTKVGVVEPEINSVEQAPRPTEIRKYLRMFPNSTRQDLLDNGFSNKVIAKAISSGKIVKDGNTFKAI